MIWHTSSKAALEKHPAFAALDESFRDSVTEAVPTLSIWRKAGPLPTGTRWDAASNSILFPEPIQLDRLTAIRFSARTEWVWVPGRAPSDPYSGVLSADGRSLRVNGSHVSSLDGLSGTYSRDVLAAGYSGDTYGAPADWLRPVLVFDITQAGDAQLFDGSAPNYNREAYVISARTPAHCLWCYVSEIATGGASLVPDTASKAELAKYKAAVATLNESIK